MKLINGDGDGRANEASLDTLLGLKFPNNSLRWVPVQLLLACSKMLVDFIYRLLSLMNYLVRQSCTCSISGVVHSTSSLQVLVQECLVEYA